MRSSVPGYPVTVRVVVDYDQNATARVVRKLADDGAMITGIDTLSSDENNIIVDITCNLTDEAHAKLLEEKIGAIDNVQLVGIYNQIVQAHLGGKIEIALKRALKTRQDLARIYTPGVASICETIAAKPEAARYLTIKKNSVAVVTDGTAVLGLGNIGPEAAMPVMEGKAALFKRFADVDAWPIALNTSDTDEIVNIVKAIAPGFGGINLEDIAAPRCFEIERRLREELDIPVFHDDQHGTAVVTLAALINALKVVGKKIEDVKVVVSGVGAAGSAIIRLLLRRGVKDIIGCGRQGALGSFRKEENPDRQWLADHTNPRKVQGSLKEVLVGADVFIGVSAGNILTGDDVATMAQDAIVFALANPTPEVDPVVAQEHAAIVATGRSDFPNQINNVLAFPGIFRGLLNIHASQVTDEMLAVAAQAIADTVEPAQLNASYIIPGVFHPKISEAVSGAIKTAARKLGLDDSALIW